MELRHLRYFVALAEEGHFGRAAERLHIVQPALSMQIRALESELGGPLFLRTSRRVQLTDAGELLLIEARRTLAQAEHARRSTERAIKGQLGLVRVGFAGNAVVSGQLMADLRAFHQHYPDAELLLRELAPKMQIEAILAGELDVGYAPAIGERPGAPLRSVTVGRWNMLVALSAEHPLASRKRLTLAMLRDEPFVLYETDERERLQRLLGHEPRIAHRVGNTLSVLAVVASGLGVAFVPEALRAVTVPGLVYKSLYGAGLPPTDLLLTYRAEEGSGAVRAFLKLASGAVGRTAPK